jgi:hypothetical protein
MEMNRHQYDQINTIAKQEIKAKQQSQKVNEDKWAALNAKHQIKETPSPLPFVLYKPHPDDLKEKPFEF